MDVEEFFDRLYSHYYVHFPCYALYERGTGFLTESAGDGSASLVLFTDEDLVQRHLASHTNEKLMPIGFHDYVGLARVFERLPRKITHVTFDPNPRFHRRYPVSAIRKSIASAASDATSK